MPIEKFIQHPALKPTVLVQDVLENVYRPSGFAAPGGEQARWPAVAESPPAREGNRAA